MVSEPESVLEDAELRDIIARYDAKFRKTMARYEASCESHFDQIMQILTRQESRFDQILTHQQTITGQFRPTTEKYINPFTPAATSHSPHFTQTVTPTNHTITTTLLPKIAKASTIPPPTQISTSTHITPHHTNYSQKNIKKIVNKIVQFHVLQVAVRDLNRFQHRNLPTSTRAATFNLHHTVHYISSTAVFPLPMFDPGGYGSIEEVGTIVAIWVAFLLDLSKFLP